MIDFCYFEGDCEQAKTLAEAMKSKHGCDCVVVKSPRLDDVYFVIPANHAGKWKLRYETVYRTGTDTHSVGD